MSEHVGAVEGGGVEEQKVAHEALSDLSGQYGMTAEPAAAEAPATPQPGPIPHEEPELYPNLLRLSPDGTGLERGALTNAKPVTRRDGESYDHVAYSAPTMNGYQKLKTKVEVAKAELESAQREIADLKARNGILQEAFARHLEVNTDLQVRLARINETDLGQVRPSLRIVCLRATELTMFVLSRRRTAIWKR